MPKWLKILIGVFSSVIILIVAAGIIFYHMLSSSLPEYSGKVYSESISSEVKIYRDSVAVPYISASTPEDAAFALGYVHAQDRIFSMDLARRAAEGRLSEIFGKETVPFDRMFLTVGIKSTSQQIIKRMNSASLKMLQSYADGVNLYIKNYKGKYPFEFDVLGYRPEYWKPVNSVELIRMMGWELNISWWEDITFTKLIQKFGSEKAKEILPDYPENEPTIIPTGLKGFSQINSNFIETDKQFRNFMGWTGTHIGSNNWVVRGKKSVTGKPIIANDTHLGFSAPDKWYVAVIKGGDWNVSGFTLPGAPAVVIGKNQDISWAMTNVMNDDADFYIEKLDSAKKKYLYDGEWKKLNVKRDTIFIKGEKPVSINIYSTEHGPIISDIHPYNILYPNGNDLPVMSMRWLGNEFSDELTSILGVDKSKNWNQFKSYLSGFAVPGQNFVYCDKDGNIGYVFGAKVPIREDNSAPSFVLDGTNSKYNWKGFVPTDVIPTLFNPSQNYIASANNKTLKDFKYYISSLWEPSSRITRIEQLLNSREKHSVENYMQYQMDFVSPYAKEITKYILDAFKDVKINDDNLKIVIQMFSEWNYKMDEFSQVPSIYAVFLKHLLRNIYLDEMGNDLFNEFVFVANVPYRSLLKLLNNPSSSWYDNVKTPETETENEIIRKSLSDALTELENRFGKEIKYWQWGKMHQVTFKHAFSGVSGLLDKFIDIGPFPVGGDGTTIFNTEYPFYQSIEKIPRFRHKEFENNLGPAMRYIFDFSRPDQFYMVLTTGESGNVMSDHYSDMSESWLRGKYFKVRTDSESMQKNKYVITITPAK